MKSRSKSVKSKLPLPPGRNSDGTVRPLRKLPPPPGLPSTDTPKNSPSERRSDVWDVVSIVFIWAAVLLVLITVAFYVGGCQQVTVQTGPDNTADKSVIKVVPGTDKGTKQK